MRTSSLSTPVPWHRALAARLGFSACALVAGLALPVTAQTRGEETWRELETAPPAQFSIVGLLPIEGAGRSSLTYGIDPSTLTVDTDGVVRYVLVARSDSGALNVLFEGIHCKGAAMKTYARWDNASAWNTSPAAPWRPLSFSGPTWHAMQLARAGVCEGPTPNGSADRVIRTLRAGRGDLR